MDLESTLRRLAPRVLAFCVACAGDRHDGEEAAQDALVALVQRWRRHGPPDNVEAFVFTVARRRARRKAVRRALLRPFSGSDDGLPGVAATDRELESRHELERTLAALASLPTAERQALLLVAVAELPLREASGVLGLSLSAMKMRVHRARERLTRVLAGGAHGRD